MIFSHPSFPSPNFLDKWVMTIALTKGIPENEAANIRSKMYAFGSFRLHVSGQEGDVDVFLLAPNVVDRTTFFTELPRILEASAAVEKLQAVPDAFVPVIKMIFNGVEMDLTFAQSPLISIPE